MSQAWLRSRAWAYSSLDLNNGTGPNGIVSQKVRPGRQKNLRANGFERGLSSASRRNIAASQCFNKRRQQRHITVRALKLERDAVGHLRPQARRLRGQRRRCRGGHPVWHRLGLCICPSAAIAQHHRDESIHPIRRRLGQCADRQLMTDYPLAQQVGVHAVLECHTGQLYAWLQAGLHQRQLRIVVVTAPSIAPYLSLPSETLSLSPA